MRRTSALIVGGGPAGSAAAIMLARAGSAPELL
ncbi:MAG: FAD-dependent monooxygenase, partial [Pseudomonadota bacterium]|nr:FAD-dependent monooxygenase [Pseudomonadota bacterium]